MSTYRVTFYVSGKRFDLRIAAASQTHAKAVVQAQYPKSKLILGRDAHRP